MPFGSELITAIKLGWQIWNVGSTKYQSAPQEFRDFLNDVRTLYRVLEQVRDAAQPNSNSSEIPLDGEFVQSTFSEANTTLKACDKLIRHNDHFKLSADGFIVNVVWAFGIKSYVQQQQERIQICCFRANLVLRSCAEGNLMQNQKIHLEITQIYHEEVQRLLNNTVDIDPTRLIDNSVRDLFIISMGATGASTVTQRLNAANHFYEAYSRTFQPQPPSLLRPSPPQYLNLLKSIFLTYCTVGEVEENLFARDVYNKAYLDILRARVKRAAGQYLRGIDPFERLPSDELLRQQDAEFEVSWWREKPLMLPGPLEPKLGEKAIMLATLVADDSVSVEQLRLFRISESRLRLAVSKAHTDYAQQVIPTVETRELDCQKLYLNPTYAASPDAPSSIICKAAASDLSSDLLNFSTINDAIRFQEHVTNFKVNCDIPAIAKVCMKTGFFDRDGGAIGENGRLQLWKYESPLAKPSDRVHSLDEGSSPVQSNDSRSSNTSRSRRSWTQQSLGSDNRHTSARISQSGVFFEAPVPSQVIILTQIGKNMRTISIQVDENTHTSPEKCWCDSKTRDCLVVIIDSPKKVSVRTHKTSNTAQDWNIAVFGRSVSRQQTKVGTKIVAAHTDVHEVQEDTAKYVSVEFTSIADRKKFQERLEIACKLMKVWVDTHSKELRTSQNTALYDSNAP